MALANCARQLAMDAIMYRLGFFMVRRVFRHNPQMKAKHNVQEQNALTRERMLECALAYQRRESYLAWVEPSLKLSGIDPTRGVLVRSSSVPCGGGEQSAHAEWIGEDRQFYAIEATIRMQTFELIAVDACRNVTSSTRVSAHEPGTGKSVGWLGLEVLEELKSRYESSGISRVP